MGKKKKRKKKRNRNDYRSLPLEVLEKKAEESLAAGKYREARDYFKELYRHDTEQYLPQLIKAHEGLALNMIEKGHGENARAVLDHIKGLGSKGQKSRLEFILPMKEGNFPDAALAALRYLAQGKEADGIEEKCLLHDALVLSFGDFDSLGSVPPLIREETVAIQSALKLLCEEKYDQALDVLRPVGLHSPFSHWKLFIKGLCAFYRMEDEKARKAFLRLPCESVPAKAAQGYLVLLDGRDGLKEYHKKTDLLGQACWVAGEKDLEPVLPRAEYLWRVGRFRDSFAFVRSNMRGFPSEGPGIMQSLSNFYFNAVSLMNRKEAEKYLSFFDKIRSGKGNTDKLEQLMIQRAECLYIENEPTYDFVLLDLWTKFLELYRNVHGEDSSLEAVVYAHLGDLFSEEEVHCDTFSPFFGGRRSQRLDVRNAEIAERCYEKSLELESGTRDVHFSLLELYEKTGQKSRANKKLDEIIRVFPEDKDALYKAGRRCVERNAFVKGMKYLERALELDPLDGNVRDSFIVCCIKAAFKHARNAQPDRYRKLLPRALQQGDENSDDFNRGHAYLYARWANFELLNANVIEAEALLNSGLALAGDESGVLYFNWLAARLYEVPFKYVKKTRKRVEEAFSGRASPERAARFAETISYFSHASRPGWLEDELKRVNHFARKAVKGDFSRDQARIIVEYALSQPNGDKNLAWAYVKRALIQDPDDPFFLFLRYQMKDDHWFRKRNITPMDELKRILALAENRRDQQLMVKIRKAMDELQDLQDMLSLDETMDDFLEDEDVFGQDGFDEDLHAFVENVIGERPSRERTRRRNKKTEKKASASRQLNLFE
ncbi:MAG: hypothetical protein JRI80_06725 [Deltaproteobacteria bacterium]|nr:hypothetical protein [Deltaproteobacteria bacterium]